MTPIDPPTAPPPETPTLPRAELARKFPSYWHGSAGGDEAYMRRVREREAELARALKGIRR